MDRQNGQTDKYQNIVYKMTLRLSEWTWEYNKLKKRKSFICKLHQLYSKIIEICSSSILNIIEYERSYENLIDNG